MGFSSDRDLLAEFGLDRDRSSDPTEDGSVKWLNDPPDGCFASSEPIFRPASGQIDDGSMPVRICEIDVGKAASTGRKGLTWEELEQLAAMR